MSDREGAKGGTSDPVDRRPRGERYAKWVDAPLQNFIRDELGRQGWTMSELARKIGSRPPVLTRWMQGTSKPSVESLKRLSQVLGASEDTLLAMAGYRES